MALLQDLTTLAKVKARMGIKTADMVADQLLTTMITEASAWFRSAARRDLFPVTAYTNEPHSGAPGRRVVLLRQQPVVAVTQVVVDGLIIPESVAVVPQANVAPAPRLPGWMVQDGLVRLVGGLYSFSPGEANCLFTYTAGFDVVPPDVEAAICELVQYNFNRRPNVGLASKSIEGETVSYAQWDAPLAVKAVADFYARINLG